VIVHGCVAGHLIVLLYRDIKTYQSIVAILIDTYGAHTGDGPGRAAAKGRAPSYHAPHSHNSTRENFDFLFFSTSGSHKLDFLPTCDSSVASHLG